MQVQKFSKNAILINTGVLLCAALGLLVPVATALSAPAVQVSSGGTHTRAEAVEASRILGEALREQAYLPGLAIAIGDSSEIVFSQGFGFADLESRTPATTLTKWRIGSISKSLTAAGAILLAERGELDLDALVSDVLPEWRDHPAAAATPRQLAGHLGGVRHYRDGEGFSYEHYGNVVDALALFENDSLVARPGSSYEYSTFGYTLLSAVMQQAAGQPFLEWMRTGVFLPLGLRHTEADHVRNVIPFRASSYELENGSLAPARFTDNSYKWAGGGFLSTPEDLVRFGNGLLDSRLLSSAGVRQLFDSQHTAAGEETGYGMGFRPREDVHGLPVVHHGGSSEGGRAFLILYPGRRLVIALSANRSTAPLFAEEAETLAHFFLDHGTTKRPEIDNELTGLWTAEGSLGDGPFRGRLQLFDRGPIRGILEWGEDKTPIRIVLVDRHDDRLYVFGVGPHGVMTMRLGRGERRRTGDWSYLGRSGSLEVTPVADP